VACSSRGLPAAGVALVPWTLAVAASPGTVRLVLVVLGATYERRLQQAREAVAWAAQLS
jgi:hypothetical protein